MLLTLLLMGHAAAPGGTGGAARAGSGEQAFVELYCSTPSAGDPAEEILLVFADRGPGGDELHVLSHRKALGVFGFEGDRPTPLADPRIRLPATLDAGATWVFSGNSIGTAAFEDGSTVYHRIFPEGPDVTREGSWGVLASYDGSALFFVRGGNEADRPAGFAVVDENGPRLQRDTPVLPYIQPSRNGDEFIVQAEGNDFYQIGAAPIGLPRGGQLHLQPAAHWVVHELSDRIELRRVTDDLVEKVPPSITPPLMAVEFEGGYVLLVTRTRAELLAIGSTARSQPVVPLFGVEATQGHRFSAAAILRRGGDRPPWFALVELAEPVPPPAQPNAPAPPASAFVRTVDHEAADVERWSIDVSASSASTLRLQWSKQGRLVASTKDRVLVSQRLFR